MFFSTFLDFLENILFQSKSQAFIRTKRDVPISLDLQRLVGDYSLLTFFPAYQVDELQNQKCETHIKKLTAMKFRNLKKLSYRSNQLERAYLEKN